MKRRIFKIISAIMTITLSIVLLLVLVVLLYIQQDKFGKNPTGKRVERMKQSPHYKDGKFQNLSHTPDLTEGVSYWEVINEFFFAKRTRRFPVDSIPSQKTDLQTLLPDQDVLIWFGHSSYFMQIDGKKILVDPVFSGNASPVPNSVKSFAGTERYTVADLPDIDYLFISHDHYDHVDYETLIALKTKTKKVICGLGVGEHFEKWGYNVQDIHEKDWHEMVELDSGFVAHTAPARHFSGRGFSRNNTLWISYVLQTPTLKIYIGGDSGYDTHFAEIGKKHGEIDLAILENGQYDRKWKYIHLLPNEVLQAAKDLKAKRLFPVHSSKFALANHAWDEPLTAITKYNKTENIPLVTPIIGEVVYLKDSTQKFSQWWVGIK